MQQLALTVKEVRNTNYNIQDAFVSCNSEKHCLFRCKFCRTTCSVRENKLCPASLTKSFFTRSNSSVGTEKNGF